MKYIKKINELRVDVNGIKTHEPLLEMARINDPKTFKFDVFVYGGNSYGSGRNEHGKPHFHFSDNIKGSKWQFSILIPTIDEWNQKKELYIYESSNGYFNWTGLKKRKEIINRMDRPTQ